MSPLIIDHWRPLCEQCTTREFHAFDCRKSDRVRQGESSWGENMFQWLECSRLTWCDSRDSHFSVKEIHDDCMSINPIGFCGFSSKPIGSKIKNSSLSFFSRAHFCFTHEVRNMIRFWLINPGWFWSVNKFTRNRFSNLRGKRDSIATYSKLHHTGITEIDDNYDPFGIYFPYRNYIKS